MPTGRRRRMTVAVCDRSRPLGARGARAAILRSSRETAVHVPRARARSVRPPVAGFGGIGAVELGVCGHLHSRRDSKGHIPCSPREGGRESGETAWHVGQVPLLLYMYLSGRYLVDSCRWRACGGGEPRTPCRSGRRRGADSAMITISPGRGLEMGARCARRMPHTS